MTRTRWMIVGLATLAMTGVALLGGSPGATPAPTPAPTTSTDARDASAVIAGPGRVEPASEEIDVAPELSGKLVTVLVQEGDAVATGQVLAQLERRDHDARLAAAEARVAVAEAERLRLQNGARAEERREATAVEAQTTAALEHATIEVDRKRRLFEGGAIARDDLDRAERDVNVAQARRQEAIERRAFVEAAPRADELARASAAVALARANVAEARALVEKTTVRAPIDGVVLRRHKEPGESVSLESATAAVVTVADTRTLRVRVDVDERDVAGVRVGQSAWVTAPAYGDRRFPGRVVRVGQMLGKKNVRTDEPVEKADTKVLETLIELDAGTTLPIGLRVDAFLVR